MSVRYKWPHTRYAPCSAARCAGCVSVAPGARRVAARRLWLRERAKGALFLLVMERLRLTSPASWLEQHIDYLSLCVTACSSATMHRR